METLYFGGRIITMTHENASDAVKNAPEALLVKNGRVRAVGDYETLAAEAGKRARRVDLRGKCLMPGFIDPHGHAAMTGQMAMLADLSGCTSFDDVIRSLREYIDRKKITPRGAVIGFGYDHNFLAEHAQPDRRVLDRVSKDIPIFILHVSAHLACINSAALDLAGITADTPDPQGGLIGRLPGSREPSGYLEEAGMQPAQKAVMPLLKADFLQMFRGVQKKYMENGITTIQDGATMERDFSMLKMMSALGLLKIDVVAYPLLSAGGRKMMQKNADRDGRYRKRLKIGGYKLVLDGSPQGRSAWMSEPYLGGEPGYCAYPWLKDEQVDAYVEQAVSEGKQLLAHCNGDAASEQYLNAYEKAVARVGKTRDLRPVMVHCQTVRNDQLDRMARLDMIASIFVGHVWYWGEVHMKNFGAIRGNRISPAKDALLRGLHVNFHQDSPVTRPDMLHSIWCAVNRMSREGNLIGADQRISVYEALRAATIEGAYQYFEEDEKGSLAVGKRADMVILSDSPLTVPETEIRNIRVLRTIKDGITVFEQKM